MKHGNKKILLDIINHKKNKNVSILTLIRFLLITIMFKTYTLMQLLNIQSLSKIMTSNAILKMPTKLRSLL